MGIFSDKNPVIDNVVNYGRGATKEIYYLNGEGQTLNEGVTAIIRAAFELDGRITFIGKVEGGANTAVSCQHSGCRSNASNRLVHLNHWGDDEHASIALCDKHASETENRLRQQATHEGD